MDSVLSRSPCPGCPGCPMCDGELTESLCGKKLECLHCGALFYKHLGDAKKPRNWWREYEVLPEDPDDRPYVWDIEED